MNHERYGEIEFSDDLQLFVFVSVGKYGNIRKGVSFRPTDTVGVYNMHFGDIDKKGEIDDFIVSNNGDRNKILATLVGIITMYTNKYPERRVFFRGSTPERTRLYRMVISAYLEELSENFIIYARVKDNSFAIPFYKNMPVVSFQVARKGVVERRRTKRK